MIERIKTAWLKMADVLSTINTFLLLSLLYVAVVIPLGLLFRAFGKSVTRTAASGSLWSARRESSALDKPF